MKKQDFSGNVAFITGAAGGIGRAVARSLAEFGAVVVASDRDETELQSFVATLREDGLNALAISMDVCSKSAVEAAVEEVERNVGSIDFLVNAAGVLRSVSIVDLTQEDWDLTFATNVRGVFLLSRAVAKRMASRSRGAIVTIASNAARVPRMGMSAYAASKAAAAMFTKCLGLEMAKYGIRCNVVEPGSTDTPMLRSLWTDSTGQDKTIKGDQDVYRGGIPLAKIASPYDIACAVVFLLSDQASQITMQELVVDGGAILGA